MKISFNDIVKTFTGSSSVIVSGKKIIVNGKELTNEAEGVLKIDVEGDIVNLDVVGDTNIYGNVKGDIDITGDLECRDVGGDVETVGNITCGNISGDISSCIGNIRMKK